MYTHTWRQAHKACSMASGRLDQRFSVTLTFSLTNAPRKVDIFIDPSPIGWDRWLNSTSTAFPLSFCLNLFGPLPFFFGFWESLDSPSVLGAAFDGELGDAFDGVLALGASFEGESELSADILMLPLLPSLTVAAIVASCCFFDLFSPFLELYVIKYN